MKTEVTPRNQFRGTGLYWSLLLALLVAVAIIVGIVQNSHGVQLNYLVWQGNVSLIVVLLATIVLTVALTSLVGVIWRRRRRQQLTDAGELYDLREQTKKPLSRVDEPRNEENDKMDNPEENEDL